MSPTSGFSSFLSFVLVLGVWSSPAQADTNPHERLKEHVRDVVQRVKRAPSPEKKRAILDEELQGMITVLNRAERMSNPTSSEEKGIDALRTRLQQKLDELHGHADYDKVPAGQLDAFADYVQQDFEQADRTVTISVTTGLLILILLILLL